MEELFAGCPLMADVPVGAEVCMLPTDAYTGGAPMLSQMAHMLDAVHILFAFIRKRTLTPTVFAHIRTWLLRLCAPLLAGTSFLHAVLTSFLASCVTY